MAGAALPCGWSACIRQQGTLRPQQTVGRHGVRGFKPQPRSAVLASPQDAGWAPGSPPDWSVEAPDSDSLSEDEEDLFPQQDGQPEFWVQNLLAAGLLAVLALSGGTIVFKLLVVAYSLVSAALRYCIVGILLMVLLTQWK